MFSEITVTYDEARATFNRLIDPEQETPVVVIQTTPTGMSWRLKRIDDPRNGVIYEVWRVSPSGRVSERMARLTN